MLTWCLLFKVIVLFVISDVIFGSYAFEKDSIHHYMDDKELQFYFGTESKFHVPHYEVAKIIAKDEPQNENLNFNLNAFDEELFLKLKPNKNLVSPFMRLVEKSNEAGERELQGRSNECHYLHIDEKISAALSGCDGNNIVRIKTQRH